MDVRFEATYWNLLQVLIWVCARKRNWVRLAADVNRDPYLLVYQATLNGTVLPFETAENEVISKLSSGELRTWALRNSTGDPAEVTSDQWGHLRFYFDPLPHLPHISGLCAAPRDLLRANSTYWTQLTFMREGVLALWRNPSEEHCNTQQAAAASEPAACGPQEAPADSTGESIHGSPRRRRPRARDKGKDALRMARILAVFAKAKTRFPDSESRPPPGRMSEILCEKSSSRKFEEFAQNTVYQILTGKYPPMKELGISLPGWLRDPNGSEQINHDLIDKEIS